MGAEWLKKTYGTIMLLGLLLVLGALCVFMLIWGLLDWPYILDVFIFVIITSGAVYLTLSLTNDLEIARAEIRGDQALENLVAQMQENRKKMTEIAKDAQGEPRVDKDGRPVPVWQRSFTTYTYKTIPLFMTAWEAVMYAEDIAIMSDEMKRLIRGNLQNMVYFNQLLVVILVANLLDPRVRNESSHGGIISELFRMYTTILEEYERLESRIDAYLKRPRRIMRRLADISRS